MTSIREAFEKMLEDVRRTWFLKFDDEDEEILYLSNALAGEVGALANEVKKYIRLKITEDSENTPNQRLNVEFEIMDILYYLVKIMDVLKMDVEKSWGVRIAMNERRWRGLKKRLSQTRGV